MIDHYSGDKYREYMRSQGRKANVSAERSRQRIDRLHAAMSLQAIADAAGVGRTTVADVWKGKATVIRDYVEARILAVEDAGIPMTGGAMIDPTGTRRRLEALHAIGFPGWVIAQEIHCHERHVWNFRVVSGKVWSATAKRVADAYDKLQYADPADFGVAKWSITRNRNLGRRKGWATPGCWDVDTIDDPEASPEWTGACGSMTGWRIHRKLDIPFCPPCLEAKRLYEKGRTKA